MLYYIILYCIVLYYIILYCIVLYCIVLLYYIVLCCTLQLQVLHIYCVCSCCLSKGDSRDKDLPEGHHQSQGCHLCHPGHHPWQHCHLCHQDECIEFRGDTKALRSRSVNLKLIRQLEWFTVTKTWTMNEHDSIILWIFYLWVGFAWIASPPAGPPPGCGGFGSHRLACSSDRVVWGSSFEHLDAVDRLRILFQSQCSFVSLCAWCFHVCIRICVYIYIFIYRYL